VILNDGLEVIGLCAFCGCTSLVHITIPPAVRAIKNDAFMNYPGLAVVMLSNGHEEIGWFAFLGCTSLECIEIPPSVSAIKWGAFQECSGLTIVILGNGVEKIGRSAFAYCTSLLHIAIPPAVRAIDTMAFEGCSNLMTFRFCNEIKEFVSGTLIGDWWDNGLHNNCLRMYCFSVRCIIPERVGLVLPRMWQSNIHDMLQCIPSISPKGLKPYFCSIDSKLSIYEKIERCSRIVGAGHLEITN
jgi:hypothetical protein